MQWDDLQLNVNWRELKQIKPLQYLDELKYHVHNILAAAADDTEKVVIEDTPSVLGMLFNLERLLGHGLKDVAFFGTTRIWNFLEHLDRCMPGTRDLVQLMKEQARTDIGRGRVFLRVALNEGSLIQYLTALRFNKDLVRKYYAEWAAIRQDELMSILFSLLDIPAPDAGSQKNFSFTAPGVDEAERLKRDLKRQEAERRAREAEERLRELERQKEQAEREAQEREEEMRRQLEAEREKERLRQKQEAERLEAEARQRAKEEEEARERARAEEQREREWRELERQRQLEEEEREKLREEAERAKEAAREAEARVRELEESQRLAAQKQAEEEEAAEEEEIEIEEEEEGQGEADKKEAAPRPAAFLDPLPVFRYAPAAAQPISPTPGTPVFAAGNVQIIDSEAEEDTSEIEEEDAEAARERSAAEKQGKSTGASAKPLVTEFSLAREEGSEENSAEDSEAETQAQLDALDDEIERLHASAHAPPEEEEEGGKEEEKVEADKSQQQETAEPESQQKLPSPRPPVAPTVVPSRAQTRADADDLSAEEASIEDSILEEEGEGAQATQASALPQRPVTPPLVGRFGQVAEILPWEEDAPWSQAAAEKKKEDEEAEEEEEEEGEGEIDEEEEEGEVDEPALFKQYGLDADTPLPEYWRRYRTQRGRPYYYHIHSRKTLWVHPVLHVRMHPEDAESVLADSSVPLSSSPLLATQKVSATSPFPKQHSPVLVHSPTAPRPEAKPTARPEWTPDNSCDTCTLCARQFTLTRRKHHCRACGHIFCKKCCFRHVPIPELRYSSPVLVCTSCFYRFYEDRPCT